MKGTRDVDRRIDRLLARYAAPSAERVHSGIDRVRGRLRSGGVDDIVDDLTGVDLAARPTPSRVLVLAAAAVIFLAAAGILTRTQLVIESRMPAVAEAGESSIYLVSDGQTRALKPNEQIAFGEIVRSNGSAGGLLRLTDGSRVEVRSRSELTFDRADDGVQIRLGKGGIIVNAAKQRTGHLYVQTRDVTVSVVGTVFLVNAEEQGSRVAVIEGEVRVQQGATEKKLLPGEQVTTSPLMPSRPVIEELAWSRNAEEHVLLLRQSVVLERSPAPTVATAAQNRADGPQVFEVASVRPSDATGPGGRGGPVGSHNTGPCTNGASQVDPRRFVAPNNTLYTLITLAYGMGSCLSTVDRLSGGPGWIRSDRFDVEALIPKGAPSYTAQQFHRGEAPVLQAMLRTLLA